MGGAGVPPSLWRRPLRHPVGWQLQLGGDPCAHNLLPRPDGYLLMYAPHTSGTTFSSFAAAASAGASYRRRRRHSSTSAVPCRIAST
jgi:hypothetical protein